MVKLATSVLFGLLAITAQAGELRFERRHHHRHHHHTPSAPYPVGNNSTVPAGTGTAPATTTSVTTSFQTSTSVVVSTVVVSPVPVASPAPAAGGSNGGEGQKQSPSKEEPAVAKPADEQCAGATTVTVTVTAAPAPSAKPEAGVAKAAKEVGAPKESTSTFTLTSLSTTFVKVYASPAPAAKPKQEEKPAAKPKPEEKPAAPKVEAAPSPSPTSTTQAAAEKPSPAPVAAVAKKPVGEAVATPEEQPKKETPAAPVTPKPAAAAAKTNTDSAAPAAVGKRGIGYESGSQCSSLSGLSWSFNWNSNPGSNCASTEFVPSLQKPSDCGNFASALSSLSNVKFAKSFNEVDMTVENGGTNVSPSQAASLYKQYMPTGKGIKLGAPSVTSYNTSSSTFTGGPSGIMWLQQFAKECSGCQIDFVDLHWYGGGGDGASQGQIFLSYVEQAIKDVDAMFGSSMPLWFSELSATPQADADPQVNKDFLDAVLGELDSNPRVQRYAYFDAGKVAGNIAGQRYSS